MTPTAEEILAEIQGRIARENDEMQGQDLGGSAWRLDMLKDLARWIKARMTEGGEP